MKRASLCSTGEGRERGVVSTAQTEEARSREGEREEQRTETSEPCLDLDVFHCLRVVVSARLLRASWQTQ